MVRRLLGDDIERELWPVLASVVLGFAGVFSFVAFFGVWAVSELDASPGELGAAFAVAAALGVVGAFSGGRLSDRVGRLTVIVGAGIGQTAVSALLLVPGLPRLGAFGVLAALSFCQPLRGASLRALVADLVSGKRVESGFAALRVALNLGASCGPLLGALLVSLGWSALHAGTTILFALSVVAALRLPRPELPGLPTDRRPVLVTLARDRVFLLVFAGAVLAWIVYQAFETLMPVSLARAHGLEPATWGLLFALNPGLTVLLQMRVTRWASPLPMETKLVGALFLLGVPFLALPVSAAIPVVGAIVVVVTIGELLWAPAAEALVAEIAPPSQRGAYIGAATAANWLGTALGPAAALAIAGALGDTAMWLFVAATAAAAAAVYAAACRARTARLGWRRDRPALGHGDEAHAGDAGRDRGGGGRRRAAPRRPDGQRAPAARG
jgi:predicted MFS family arabinose efflux permease